MYGSHELIVWTTPMRVERDPASTELVAAAAAAMVDAVVVIAAAVVVRAAIVVDIAAVVVVAAVTTGKNSMATNKQNKCLTNKLNFNN
jgi:hypothetical protein